jgi:hypothetical protein
LGIAADGHVGFRFIGTILEAVGELAATNPGLATKLATAGAYWADRLVSDMVDHQDSIEAIRLARLPVVQQKRHAPQAV